MSNDEDEFQIETKAVSVGKQSEPVPKQQEEKKQEVKKEETKQLPVVE